MAGAIQCFVGYLLMWLSVTGIIHRPAVPLMCMFMFVAAHGQTFYNTANVVTAVKNFPDYGGTIVGIMKGCLGLSGAVLIQVYHTFLNGNPSVFILMLAFVPALVSLSLMCLVRIYETNSRDEKKYLNAFSAVVVVIAVYLMIIIILENVFTLPLWARAVTFVLLLLLLASLLEYAMEAHREDSGRRLSQITSSSTERNPLLNEPEVLESDKFSAIEEVEEVPNDLRPEEGTSIDKMEQDGEDLNLFQAMSTANFWLLFIAMACGMGSGLATINNISQIGESLGYTSVERSTLVSLWSIWNFSGRFGAGYVSDILLHRLGWGRPLLMAITLGTMSIGHVIIASGFTWNLYLGSVLVGVCYGSQWSLMPTITSEIFGVRHMGTIFNTIAVASPIGSYSFSVRIIGYFYDKEASSSDEGNSCTGTHCFLLSFLIMASVTLFACLVAFVLFIRTRSFYKVVYVRRLKHNA